MGKNLRGKELGSGISQLQNGKYCARYRRKDGTRPSKWFDKLEDARKWVNDYKYNDISASSNMFFDTWFNYWLKNIKGDTIREGTHTVYNNRYKSRMKDLIGDMQLSTIKSMHCQNVLNQAYNKGDHYDSVKKLRSIMYSVFQSAVENELITKNPVTSSVKALGEESKEKIILTAEEQREFTTIATDYAAGDIFLFALETGLRAGELLGLKWSDIDYKNRILTVKRTLIFDEGRFKDSPPKTKSSNRIVPLTTKAISILKERKKLKLPVVLGYQDYVFLNGNGKPQHTAIYNRVLKSIGKKIGVEGLSMHSLRHSFATRCIESGMRPKTLQKILGHSSLSMTMDLYVHVTFETELLEMQKFEKWASGGRV